MTQQVPIQKDIGEYKEKIVGKMSLRTLACVIGGFASAVLVAAIMYFVFHINVGNATLPVMAAAMPFWLAGFWRPGGMKLEEFARLLYRHVFVEMPLVYEPQIIQMSLPTTYPKPGKPSRKARKKAKRKGAELYEPKTKTKQEHQGILAIKDTSTSQTPR